MRMKLVSRKDFEIAMEKAGGHQYSPRLWCRTVSPWKPDEVIGELTEDGYLIPNYLYQAYLSPSNENALLCVKSELKTLQSLSLWGWIGKLSSQLIHSRNKGKHHE